jgi:hypothetical protein
LIVELEDGVDAVAELVTQVDEFGGEDEESCEGEEEEGKVIYDFGFWIFDCFVISIGNLGKRERQRGNQNRQQGNETADVIQSAQGGGGEVLGCGHVLGGEEHVHEGFIDDGAEPACEEGEKE